MAPPSDNSDLENGPEQYVDEDGVSSLRGFGRKLVWGKKTPTISSFTSKNSKHSLRGIPFKIIKRGTNSSQFTNEEGQKRPSEGRKLIEFLSSGQERTEPFLDACDWYVKFIDSKCKAHWRAIRPVIEGVKVAEAPDAMDIAIVDKVLATIAIALSETQDFALSAPVDDLINQNMMTDDGVNERVALHQLMFTFLGWLTNLYDPRLDCKPKKLQVSKFTMNTEGIKIKLHSRTFDNNGQDLDHYADEPFWLLLGRFGEPIPKLPLRKQFEVTPSSEWIGVPSLCYQTLRHVCGIEIEWVDAIGMHLEFDSSHRLLKLYRFPSFCRLMYKHKDSGLHSKLFNDKERGFCDDTRTKGFVTNDFFREMLLTYRLIFGQDLKSSKLFAKEMAAVIRRHSKLKAASARGLQPHIFALPDADPLLPSLCTLHADEPGVSEVYNDVKAGILQSFYTPDSYPFFAEKLLMLQAYVKEQHPRDWWTLWHDHRNKSNWWQFWAVLFIGGGTLILGTLSLGFQVWQAVLTQQQLIQGMNNASPAVPLSGDI